MRLTVRFAAVVAFTLLATPSISHACSCEATCTKLASTTVIGPVYPATINYDVGFACTDPSQCGCIGSMSDTLVPDAFTQGGFGTILCFPREGDHVLYSLTVTWEQCKAWGSANGDGTYTLKNVATTDAIYSPSMTCDASVICRPPDEGCTATLGYWKTHADGRKYDATWDEVGGPGAPFFISGQTWLQVLSNPTETMKYYILARQYIAAVLNGFAGASTPANVDAALTFAFGFFSAYEPTDALSDALAAQVVANAAILDSYNNGFEGPLHCD